MEDGVKFEDWLPADARGISMLQPYGDHESRCGYCKGEAGSATFGMAARRLTVLDYQALIDSNWRRSGTYLYRPRLEKSCCPLYTIRLDVGEFRASKQQNQLLRRMQRFLDGEIDLLSDDPSGAPAPSAAGRKPSEPAELASIAAKLDAALRRVATAVGTSGPVASTLASGLPAASASKPHPLVDVHLPALQGGGKRPLFASAAAMRLSAAARKAGEDVAPSSVAAALVEAWAGDAEAQTLALLRVASAGQPFLNFEVRDPEALREVDAARAAAAAGGGATPTLASHLPSPSVSASASSSSASASSSSASASSPGPRKHTLRVEMVPARFDEDSFRLYRRYQKAIHGDKDEDLTERQYRGFLVDSPLLPRPVVGPEPADVEAAESLRAAAEEAGADEELVALTAAALGSLDRASTTLKRLLATAGPEELRESLSSDGAAVLQARLLVSRALRARAWRDGEGAGAGLPGTAALAHARASASASASAGDGTEDPLGGSDAPGFGRGARAHGLGSAPELGGTGLSQGFGSFHHKYYLDDRLIAVGVVDVLPLCLSSVYVFYDPDMPRLQLGRYTALREVQWVQAASRRCPRLRHYYMGYYVHSCQKMRYKADYRPSRLLCPVTGDWVDMEVAKRVLSVKRFARLDGSTTDLTAAAAQAPQAGQATKPRPRKAKGKPKKAKPAKTASCSDRLAEARPEMREVPEEELAEAKRAAEAMPLVLVRSKAVCRVSSLTPAGRDSIRPLLQTMVQQCTPHVAARVLVFF